MDANARRLDDVWTRFLAGEPIDRQDRFALSAAVRSDDVLHRRLLYDLRLDGALRAAAQSEAGGDAFVQRLRALAAAGGVSGIPGVAGRPQPAPGSRGTSRSKSVVRTAAVVAGGALLAALILLRAAPVQPPVAPVPVTSSGPLSPPAPVSIQLRVVAATGQVRLHRQEGSVRPAQVSESILPGDWLATVGAGSRVLVEGDDGTEIELGGDALATGLGYRPGQGRLFVARGRLRISIPSDSAAPAPELISPHASVIADGCFRVEVSAAETRIESHRRRLRAVLLTTGSSVDVRAGQFTVARSDQLSPAAPLWGVRRVSKDRPSSSP